MKSSQDGTQLPAPAPCTAWVVYQQRLPSVKAVPPPRVCLRPQLDPNGPAGGGCVPRPLPSVLSVPDPHGSWPPLAPEVCPAWAPTFRHTCGTNVSAVSLGFRRKWITRALRSPGSHFRSQCKVFSSWAGSFRAGVDLGRSPSLLWRAVSGNPVK